MDPQLIKKLHQLTGATGLSDDDLFLIGQLIGGVNKTRKVDLATLQDYFSVPGPTGATGVEGPVGPQGSTGDQGPPGSIDNLEITPNTGLSYTSNQLSTIYNTPLSDYITSIQVGGASAAPASEWKNKSLVAALDAILFPTVLPTYTPPTVSLSASVSGIVEVGTMVNQTITLEATDNDAGAFTELNIKRNNSVVASSTNPTAQDPFNLPLQFTGITNPNNPAYKYRLTHTENYVAAEANSLVTWSSSSSYLNGLAKNNNKGIADVRDFEIGNINAPQAAANDVSSNTITVEALYPYFWGTSLSVPTELSVRNSVLNQSCEKALLSSQGNISIVFNANAEYFWFAVQAGYPLKTKWYNTEFNAGDIGSGNIILSPILVQLSSFDGKWTMIPFNLYISRNPTTTTGTYILKNS